MRVVPAAAKLGKTQPNPAFRIPDRPWTDRNPWLLNCALAVAVVAMGLVTLAHDAQGELDEIRHANERLKNELQPKLDLAGRGGRGCDEAGRGTDGAV